MGVTSDLNKVACWAPGKLASIKARDPHLQAQRQLEESCLVREAPSADAICRANSPELAAWIATRLNLAARYEKIGWHFSPVDYATLILTHSGKLHDKMEAIVNEAFRLGAAARMAELDMLVATVEDLKNQLQTAKDGAERLANLAVAPYTRGRFG